MKHYPFGSSTAGRTDACQQWKIQSDGVPRKESKYALDGTIVHTLLEQRALDDDYRFDDQLGRTVEGGVVTGDLIEMAKAMWVTTEYVLKKYGAYEWEPEVTGEAAADVGGTLDLIANCGDLALMIDYKTGRGVQVDAAANSQLLFAAAVCSIDSTGKDLVEGKDKFIGIIIQPDQHGDIQIKEWPFTRKEVDTFWRQHERNINLARKGDGALVAGDHCKFCPANGLCDATTGNLLRLQQLNLEDQAQLLEGLNMIEQVNDTIRAIEKLAFEQLELGVELGGWKLVMKRATEKWKDEKKALAKLRRLFKGKRNIVKTALISPAQIRQLAKTQKLEVDLEDLTVRESSGTTLAPPGDKREAVLSAAGFAAALNSVK